MLGKEITLSVEQAAATVSRPLGQDGNVVRVKVDNLKRNFS
jgi:hypothetical protein